MTHESWKPVTGFEGLYSVSDLGRVRSNNRTVQRAGHNLTVGERILSAGRNPKTGYMVVSLWKDGRGHTRHVHELVAQEFVPNPDGLPMVDHADRVRGNCAAANLRWVTRSLNNLNSLARGIRFNPDHVAPWLVYFRKRFIGAFSTRDAALVARAKEITAFFSSNQPTTT